MKNITDFRPEIIMEVPRVTNEATDWAIISTIQDLCDRTQIYKVYLDDLYVIKGITDYELMSSEANTIITSLSSVTKNGIAFTDYVYDLVTFHLTSVPIDDFVLMIQASIKPERSATSIHDMFFNNYYEHIIAGAKAKLMLQLSKPWSNPALGAKYQTDYESKVGQIRIDMQKQFSSSSNLRVQLRSFT